MRHRGWFAGAVLGAVSSALLLAGSAMADEPDTGDPSAALSLAFLAENGGGYVAPICVGIRGNGPRLWAHYSSIARIIEEFGAIGGAAGGSSGSISVFLAESINANPLLRTCDGRPCSQVEFNSRMALLYKSIQGLQSTGLIADVIAVVELVDAIAAGGIEDLLNSDEPLAGVEALLDILQDADLQNIINPELLTLILQSPDPVFHANDVVAGLQASLSFQVNDALPLVRPGPINFAAFANLVGRLGSFYAGYGPFDASSTQSFLSSCAVQGRGMDWPAVAQLPSGQSTCGEQFAALFDTFRDTYDPQTDTNRLDDPIGLYLPALVTTSVLQGEAIAEFAQAKASYFAAEPVSLDVNFDDVGFGFWGATGDLNTVAANIGAFDDPKSARFTSLGEDIWRNIVSVSPAEPGLSRALELPDGRVSAGGWSDAVPTQVLKALNCPRVILVNRRDGIGSFTAGVARQLGASEAQLDAQFSLEDPNSGFARSLSEADGVWCTDWDAPGTFDVAGLFAAGWNPPLETADRKLLTYGNAGTGLGIAGCTPGVSGSE
ncbi:MAG: hypothetical protein AB8G16_18300 [Gammaproteobacteria bacterium]